MSAPSDLRAMGGSRKMRAPGLQRAAPAMDFGRAEFVVAGDALVGASSEAETARWQWKTSKGSSRKKCLATLRLVALGVPMPDAHVTTNDAACPLINIHILLSPSIGAHKPSRLWFSGSTKEGGTVSSVAICKALLASMEEVRSGLESEGNACLEELFCCLEKATSITLAQKSSMLVSIQAMTKSMTLERTRDRVGMASQTFSSSCSSLEASFDLGLGSIVPERAVAGDLKVEERELAIGSGGGDMLTALPEECLVHILSMVRDPISLMNAMKSCKLLYRVGQEDRCWAFFPLPERLLESPYQDWSNVRRCKFFVEFSDEAMGINKKWYVWRSKVKKFARAARVSSPRKVRALPLAVE